MRLMKIVPVLLVITIALQVGAAADAGQDRGTRDSLRKLGFKFYWSLLDADQQMQAKEIVAAHLAETAADRLDAAAKVTAFRGAMAKILTPVQIRKLAKIRQVGRALPREKRAELFGRLLDTTDRAAFTDRVARLADADAEARVRIGIELLDQVVDMYLKAYGPRMDLTREQETRIREEYAALKTDLEPVARRLSVARAKMIEDGLAILTEEQRAKVGEFKDTVLTKILDWLRG